MTDNKQNSRKNRSKIEKVLNGDVTKLVDLQKDIIKRLEKIIFELNNLSV